MIKARSRDAAAAMACARNGLSVLEREMETDGREVLELLDEQILSLRNQEATELLAAREEVVRAMRNADAMLDSVRHDVGALWHKLKEKDM